MATIIDGYLITVKDRGKSPYLVRGNVTICHGQKPYTISTILIVVNSEIDLSVGLAAALDMLAAPLTLDGVGFFRRSAMCRSKALERRRSRKV
jgi:hypothetical protein